MCFFILSLSFCLATPEIASISEENLSPAGNVSFAVPPATTLPGPQDLEVVPETFTLANELFGNTQF